MIIRENDVTVYLIILFNNAAFSLFKENSFGARFVSSDISFQIFVL